MVLPAVVLWLIGFLRWVFVVPPLADSYAGGDTVTRAAVDAAWTPGRTSSAAHCSAGTRATRQLVDIVYRRTGRPHS